MALAQVDLEQIQVLITDSIAATPAVANANVRYELELRDRTTRVEEELKHQRELILTGFAQMDKRFEQSQSDRDKRFEQIQSEMGKRFEQVQSEMDKRSEEIDRRFEQAQSDRDKRFEQMQSDMDKRGEQIDKRFEQVDKRFEQIQANMDRRFEKVDQQFEKQSQAIMGIHQEIKLQMRWSFGVLLGVGGLVVGILRFMG